MYGAGDLWSHVGQAGPDRLVSAMAAWMSVALASGAAGWLLRASREREVRRKGPEIIYREISEALDEARRAPGPSVITAAEALDARVRLYLGPLFDFHSAEGRALEKLRKALEGRIKVKPADLSALVVIAPAAPGAAAASSAAAGASAASAAAAGGGGLQVEVITPAPPPPPGGDHREASTREHVNEVRAALDEFDVLWKAARVDQQLRRIQAALLISSPLGPPGPVGVGAPRRGA